MDREVFFEVGGEKIHVGYVSDFISPRGEEDRCEKILFEIMRESIENIDFSECETKPIIISFK